MATIVGISAFYHDSAAALVVDGKIVAAAQEERFSRKKHDASFPTDALSFCLDEADLSLGDVDHVVFYDKPLIKFERLLETYMAYAPKGLRSFIAAMPVWLKEKLYVKSTLRKGLAAVGGDGAQPQLLFSQHHQSHAASAFYPSPFQSAAVLCLDGVGEWATTTAWLGDGDSLTKLWEIDFPHSLGLLYSAFTYYCGFKVNSGEYKLMGLAPYGEPRFVDLILNELMDLKEDGSFRLNMDFFNYCTGLTMTSSQFHDLFGGDPRTPENEITHREMDIAASIQAVTEEVVLRLARTLREESGQNALCLAGGVALNCVANGRVLRESGFEDVWVQPAAGDAGGAVGAALIGAYEFCGDKRSVLTNDAMHGSYLGPSYTKAHIDDALGYFNARFDVLDDDEFFATIATRLAEGNVVGWFQGRMEFGPRALGGRSILGDPRNERMQSVMNQKIKFRESFRPFAPAVLAEDVSEYFHHEGVSPYMLMVAPVSDAIRNQDVDNTAVGFDRLHVKRSQLPAITHVDGSARIQTVHEHTNPRFYKLLEAFRTATGCGVLINTSFNVRGEPIVCTPEDAYRCFMRTEMDMLVLEDRVLFKHEQPEWGEPERWLEEFELD